ncbi:hypothetical protein SeMB42_g05251 [Synchytrium endobioticum]|nr:hypothetical protein SeMB42_g05251 [Synchytrium endobioticum]
MRHICCPCTAPHPESVSEYISVRSGACCCFASWPPQSLCCGGTRRIPHPDILYFSHHNEIFLSPFLVAVDRSRKAIVVAIRGSLSTSDIITDLALQTAPLEITAHDNPYTHSGMLACARRILQELEHEGVMHSISARYADHALVVVGHSLGAGVAALLTHLLRTAFPSVVCFAYGPPAVLASPSTSHYFATFVTSVILNADLVCRLTRRSLHALQGDVVHAVQTCRERKVDVLGKAVVEYVRRAVGIARDGDVEDAVDETTPIALESPPSAGASASMTRWRGFDADPEMTLPGRIMHLVKDVPSLETNASFVRGRSAAKNKKTVKYKAVWANYDEFKHIVISSSMLSDHLPNNYKCALGMVEDEVEVEEEGEVV